MATENPAPVHEIIRTVGDGLAERGWVVRHIESSPLSGRLIATDPATGEERGRRPQRGALGAAHGHR